jgi:hypothetical protein
MLTARALWDIKMQLAMLLAWLFCDIRMCQWFAEYVHIVKINSIFWSEEIKVGRN